MKRMTIIGAGMAGLVCAALAQARGYGVTVIEAGATVGGLWQSKAVDLAGHRLFLDVGLRLPVATGDDRIDALLFHRPDFAFDWVHFDGWPRESAITAHRFNPENSCIDATMLGDRLATAIAEMRAAEGEAQGAPSALDHSLRTYGPLITHSLIRDAVIGLFGAELADLDARAVTWFVPRRMIMGDHAATARLLEDEALTGRIAHARHADLPRGMNRPFLRPATGGISTWVAALQSSLAASGVRFLFNDGVDRFAFDESRIDRLILKSGEHVEAGDVLSTIAPSLLARATGREPVPPPPFRHLRISHMLVDRPPDHQASYSLNFNPEATFFRAIFHDNLGDTPPGAHVVTFEHLVTDDHDHAALALAQCIRAGAMPAGTQAIAAHADLYRNSLPVPTLSHGRAATALLDDLASTIPNLHFVGRSAGGAPFLDQIILEIDRALGALAGACHHD